jgi:hypothetical protein
MPTTRIGKKQIAEEMATETEVEQVVDAAISAALAAQPDGISQAMVGHIAGDEHLGYAKSVGLRPTFDISTSVTDQEILIFDSVEGEWINGSAHLAHGYPDRVSSTMAYNSVTRTLTLSQIGGVVYWYKGKKVVAPEVITLQHAESEGAYYYMFDDASGVLKVKTTSWNLDDNIPTCYVFWIGTDGLAWEERHGHQRNIAIHKYLHATQGTKLVSGLLMSGYTLEDGSDASKTQWVIGTGSLADEDITVATSAISAGGPYLIVTRDLVTSQQSWTFNRTPTVPYEYGANIQYDNNGVLTDLAHGQYVNYWLYGATTLAAPHVFTIVGQEVHATLDQALAETLTGLNLTNLPIKECVPIYKVTFRCDNGYITPGKACIFFVDVIDITYKKSKQPIQYLDLIATKEPTAPAPNHMSIYAQSRSGRLLPHWVENNGLETAVQPALFGNNVILWLPNTGSSVSIAFGASFTNRNNGGGTTPTTPVLTGANAVTQMKRAVFGTGTSSGGTSGVQTAATAAWRGNLPNLGGFFFFARHAYEAYSNTQRVLIGLSALNGDLNQQPGTILNTIALVKDSTDSTLQILCSNTTQFTKIDTGIVPSPNQILDLILFCKPSDSKAYARIVDPITGVVYVDNLELSATLPDPSTFMYMHAQVQSTTGSTAKLLAVNRLYLETNT